MVHISRAAAALCTRPVPWRSSVLGVTIPRPDSDVASLWEVATIDQLPDFILVDEGDPEPPIRARIATYRLSFRDLYARAVQDLCLAVGQLGVTLWTPAPNDLLGTIARATGARPSGAVAILLGEDTSIDAKLVAGDIAVLVGAPKRARVQAARERGARVVQPKWTTAVAQAAESLIALYRELGLARTPGTD